jgi:hypothetical protein
MTVSRYRLTKMGWLGAVLFVLPTPISAWKFQSTLASFAARTDFDKRVENMSGAPAVPEFSPFFFTAMATVTLIGLVLLLVGREIETD